MLAVSFTCLYLVSCVQLFMTFCTVAHQAPLSMGLSSWHSDIGIPILFQEESGIVTLWRIEFRVLLEQSKGCEAPYPEEADTYGFL